MKDLFIFGTADAAALAHFHFSRDKKYTVVGFVVDSKFKQGDEFCGLPVIDSSSVLKRFPIKQHNAFVAIGYSGLNELRRAKYEWLKETGYSFANCISSQATCLTDQIGDNCFIQEGTIIQPLVKIGNNVTIWSGAHIGHHSVIEDHCFIAPRASLSGHVTLGEMSFVGINATIKDRVIVGRRNLIAAGALVVENTQEDNLQKNLKSIGSKLTQDTINKI